MVGDTIMSQTFDKTLISPEGKQVICTLDDIVKYLLTMQTVNIAPFSNEDVDACMQKIPPCKVCQFSY